MVSTGSSESESVGTYARRRTTPRPPSVDAARDDDAALCNSFFVFHFEKHPQPRQGSAPRQGQNLHEARGQARPARRRLTVKNNARFWINTPRLPFCRVHLRIDRASILKARVFGGFSNLPQPDVDAARRSKSNTLAWSEGKNRTSSSNVTTQHAHEKLREVPLARSRNHTLVLVPHTNTRPSECWTK